MNFKYKYLVRTAESWTLNDGNWQSSSITNLDIADGIVACKFNKPWEVEIIKLVTIYFVHIYYTPESHSVYNYFCFVFVFDIFLFSFYLFVCFFCFVFVLIFIQDLDWEPNSIDVSLICIQSQLLLIIKEWFL